MTENVANGFTTDIEEDTLENEDYRRVLYTGENTQLVLMTLQPGEEIGLETHSDIDQFIRIEAGTAQVVLDDEEISLEDDDIVVIPDGAEHNVTNTSEEEALRLYTLYSPPEHPDGTVHATKQDEPEDH
ncbi:cupin domain-containing protein [Halococcus salsus]|uniref:cupin domain-containing protein n=1 Tax=Halococcus salsus TaxID=2162894 RepID=UPI00135933F1|nr:cupin domain-containing protein [Halococcus salsus]